MCGLIMTAGAGHADRARSGMDWMLYRGTRTPSFRDSGEHGWTVGHIRLPIIGIDHEDGIQPKLLAHGALAFVGEVFGYQEHTDEYGCDAAYVRDAVESHGPSALIRHDGFWSVAWADGPILRAMTDYLAQKPTYYGCGSNGGKPVFAVASEPIAVYEAIGGSPLDELYLADAAKWGYCPDPTRTPFAKIRRLPPGGALSVDARDLPGHVDYVPIRISDPIRPAEIWTAKHLQKALREAVRRRVDHADLGISALVSGGLDSAIAYRAGRELGRNSIHAFHVENGEDWGAFVDVMYDDATGFPSGWTKVDPARTPAPTIDEQIWYMQEPIDLGSLVPQIQLAREIAGTSHVCLTGDGADELFGGYGRASRYDSQASDVWRELVAWHLPRLDRVMMRHRIEVRTPFLARKVLELSLAIPWHLRQDKAILREIADFVPDAARYSKKRALRTPDVERDRESKTIEMIDAYRRKFA